LHFLCSLLQPLQPPQVTVPWSLGLWDFFWTSDVQINWDGGSIWPDYQYKTIL
jgi:hypothetical protein